MSTNSKAALLSWLEAADRMNGREGVFAIDKAKADTLLTQEYIRRFNTSSYLAPVNGETKEDNGYKVLMQNFILDHPRLSFDNAEITSSKASLRMKIVGGNQVALKKAGAHWYPQRIDRIEPVVGPELRLRLDLSQVPGVVAEDGSVTLDLRHSSDFIVTFSDSRKLQEDGGDFFKALFLALPDEKRKWSLGQIKHGDDDLLRPESFTLRTQRNPSVAYSPMEADNEKDVDGAVLGLVRMIGSTGDASSEPGADYRYLIPDDSDKYSATVLFEKRRVMMAALLRQLPRSVLKDVEFSIQVLDNGDITATATDGWLEFPGGGPYSDSFEGSALHPFREVACEIEVVVPPYRVPLRSVLSVKLTGDRIALEMSSRVTGYMHTTRYFERHYVPHPHVNPLGVQGGLKADFGIVFRADWTVQEAQGVYLKLNHFEFDYVEDPTFYERAEPFPPEGTETGRAIGLDHWAFAAFAPFTAFTRNARETSIPAVRAALAKDLATHYQLDQVIENTIQLNFGGAIQGHDYRLPRDVACFGGVNPKSTSFRVTPLEQIMVQGDKLQFSTVPPQPDVEWSAEAVEGSQDEAGHFDQSTKGLYLAPGASAIQGDFTRIRVTATAKATGFTSSALITVVKNALGLSPLVDVCQTGDAGVSLKAGHVSGGDLSWRILGAQPFGSLANPNGETNTYIPGPEVAGKSFVVEEVEVQNNRTAERRTLCVITQMASSRPADVLVEEVDTSLGRVRLVINAGGQFGLSDLTVVHGPGRVEKDGEGRPYYQADLSSPKPFCVVRAFWEPMPGFPFTFEGFIVLPLPLGESAVASETYRILEHAAARQRKAAEPKTTAKPNKA